MKRKIGIILLAAALLSGCSQEVVTVAGTLSEEGEKPEAYIEMQEFELKEPAEQSSMTKISSCVVLIPSRYQESEEIPGMYIHEKVLLTVLIFTIRFLREKETEEYRKA